MCHFMNLHKNHKLVNINDEEQLKKENIYQLKIQAKALKTIRIN